jgi:hypothetical protein
MAEAPHDVAFTTHDTAAALHYPGELERFIDSLTDAIAWCTVAGSLSYPKTSLRTCKPELDDLIDQHSQVFRVGLKRSRRLLSAGREDLPAVTGLCGGRLVAYFPGDSLSDGLTETESKGFFDVNDIPPYDTWVWIVRNVRRWESAGHTTSGREANYLVAWVPPDFIALADTGISVNPGNCIMWLDELDDNFVGSLRSMNFLSDAPFEATAPGVEHT